MVTRSGSRLTDIVKKHEAVIVTDWINEQLAAVKAADRISEADLRSECARFLSLLRSARQASAGEDITASGWSETREMLGALSRSRAKAGYTPSETAVFVLALKLPLFDRLRGEIGSDAQTLADEVWYTTV